MELALSFNSADSARIESYAARKNMSAIDYIRAAVMKPIDEETRRDGKEAAMLAMKRLQGELEGAGKEIGLASDEDVADWITESRRKERAAE
ncbi:MAG: hypothetical protein IJ631_06905 [Schwartzia sp.]|nr:hypothetical protein [Schwartzia sp. (in: firmicutes)]